jgi:hypothetical protein
MYFTEFIRGDLEAYYKPMYNLIDVNTSKFSARNTDFVNVEGEAYGSEILLRIEPLRWYAQIGYALSWANRVSGGVPLPPRYDVRHSLSLLAGVETADGWSFNVAFALKSGFPFTPIAGFYDRLALDPSDPSVIRNQQEPVVLWGDRNTARLPVYHRLDASCEKRFHLEPFGVTVGLSMVNLYDRKNIYYFDRDTGKTIYMLRWTPSATLKVQW